MPFLEQGITLEKSVSMCCLSKIQTADRHGALEATLLIKLRPTVSTHYGYSDKESESNHFFLLFYISRLINF